MTLSGGNLYVSYEGPANGQGTTLGYVGEYSATTGDPVSSGSSQLVSVGPSYYIGAVAVSGNDLYVAYTNLADTEGYIGEYNATTGQVISTSSATLISGTNDPGLDGIVFAVPEPSIPASLALGTAALLGWRRQRRFAK